MSTAAKVVARLIVAARLNLEPDPAILRRWVPYWMVWNCARKR